jgi:sporulation protein YlmC with PRC-barrel domain
MKPRALSASSLTGTSVKNMENKNIGTIQDLMIELETGNVLYAVLSFGGFMGLGDDYFAIPMEALVFNADDQKIIKLDINKERLENAPGFNKDNWPEHSTHNEFVDSIYSHYGYNRKASQ